MDQTLKPIDRILISTVSTNNQPLPDSMVGYDNWKLSINCVYLGLESDQVCSNVLTSIVPMTVLVLEVGGDSASWYPKNIFNEFL